MKDGGPAFPVLHTIDGNWVKEPKPDLTGMTLRDYFAAYAMQSLIQTCLIDPANEEWAIALNAYRISDAMLKEREKK